MLNARFAQLAGCSLILIGACIGAEPKLAGSKSSSLLADAGSKNDGIAGQGGTGPNDTGGHAPPAPGVSNADAGSADAGAMVGIGVAGNSGQGGSRSAPMTAGSGGAKARGAAGSAGASKGRRVARLRTARSPACLVSQTPSAAAQRATARSVHARAALTPIVDPLQRA